MNDEVCSAAWTTSPMREGGFDVILGNPPWERIKLQEKEWFAERRPEVAGAPTAAARRRLIEALQRDDPALYRAFAADCRKAEGQSSIVRNSGRYPLCGRGDVNTYSVFAELKRSLIGPHGRVGAIVPSGIATDDTTKLFFQDLMERRALVSLYDFENRRGIFPGVHRSYKFCLLTLAGSERPVTEGAEFAFFLHDVADLRDPQRRFTLTAEDIALLNPNTRTCPIFRTRRDARISKAIYRRVPVHVRKGPPEENPWGVSFLRMFDMANDSRLFRTREQLEGQGFRLQGNVFIRAQERYLPLYEAKFIHQFDHRHADCTGGAVQANRATELSDADKQNPDRVVLPRYWVPAADVAERLRPYGNPPWLVGFRDVTRATDFRTCTFTLLPRSGVGHTLPLILMPGLSAREIACWLANINSFAQDHQSRQKPSGIHLTFFIVEQLPVFHAAVYDDPCPWKNAVSLEDWLLRRVVELIFTAWDLEPFARDCGYDCPPFHWDADRRFLIRCELDAAFLHLYGISRDDADYILDTFPIAKARDERRHGEYRTKRIILEMYDEMAAAITTGRPYRTRLDPPPADPSLTHPPRRVPAAVPAAAAAVGERPFRIVHPAAADKYRTCVPIYSLKAAAGQFGDAQLVEPEGWAEPSTGRPLRRGMFVAQVSGRSMEPQIPDGSWCLFQRPVTGTRDGRILLVQHRSIADPETGGSYTVKRYRSEKARLDDGTWQHTRIILEPLNGKFQPIVLDATHEGDITVIAELIEVLRRSSAGLVGPTPAGLSPSNADAGVSGALPGFEPGVAAIHSKSKRRQRDKELVLRAFRDVRDGRSADYVIAAPDLNRQFLDRARELGVERPETEINLMLLGARKAGRLGNEPTTRRYRLPRAVLPFVFASEWAARHLQREVLAEANREPSLDDILCDPELACRFDAIAARIKPGFSPLEYRWAALGLRKSGRQRPDAASVRFSLNKQLVLFDLDPAAVPATRGLYLIQAGDRPLYVNAADNLRDQVIRHRECGGRLLVPDWLSAAAGSPDRLVFAPLCGVDVRRLKEARIRHVADLRPWLNLLDLPGAA